MRSVMLALHRGIFALPLLIGPWLIITGSWLMIQVIMGVGPRVSRPYGALVVVAGALLVIWAVHGLRIGQDLVRGWWLLLCSIMNANYGISALYTPSDPEFIHHVAAPLALGWSLAMLLAFTDRRRRAQKHDA